MFGNSDHVNFYFNTDSVSFTSFFFSRSYGYLKAFFYDVIFLKEEMRVVSYFFLDSDDHYVDHSYYHVVAINSNFFFAVFVTRIVKNELNFQYDHRRNEVYNTPTPVTDGVFSVNDFVLIAIYCN